MSTIWFAKAVCSVFSRGEPASVALQVSLWHTIFCPQVQPIIQFVGRAYRLHIIGKSRLEAISRFALNFQNAEHRSSYRKISAYYQLPRHHKIICIPEMSSSVPSNMQAAVSTDI